MQEVLIAILSAWLTSFLTAKYLKVNDNKNREASIANSRCSLANALHAELINFYKIYEDIKLPHELPFYGGDVALSHISQRYITVYEGQLNKLGILDKADLPNIIKLYIYIKALIDSRNQLNDICKEHINYERKKIADPSKSPYGNMLDAYKIALKYQEEVYILYPDVLKQLKKYDTSKEN